MITVREEPHKLHGSMNARQECVGTRAGKDRVYISVHDEMMSIYHGVSQYILPFAHSISVIPVSPYAPPPITQSISIIPVSLYTPRRLPPATLSGGGGEKWIFPPQRELRL